MIKQKVQTFLLSFLAFGTNISFIRYCLKGGGSFPVVSVSAAGCALIVLSCFFAKARKTVSATAVRAQPLAAVVFTAAFVLSFLPYSMAWGNLFTVLVLNAVCFAMAFETPAATGKRAFAALFCSGALAGAGAAFSSRIGLVYVCFAVLSFLCRPKEGARTAQDVWKDVAFPLFVLIGSFLLFIAAHRGGAFPSVIAESIVMLMTGGLLMVPSSSLRLTLMTVVMMIFGSYVFSVQNQASVFNHSGKASVRAERLF